MQSSRRRHSREPESVSLPALLRRSEIVCTPSSAARACVIPTALEFVNGVGGSAVMPASAKPSRACSNASCSSLGILSGCTPKNVVSAVPVYSG